MTLIVFFLFACCFLTYFLFVCLLLFFSALSFFLFLAAECWSGDDAWLTYNKDGPSKKCLNVMFTPCDENCEEEACFGNDDAVFVYGIGQREFE